MYYTYVYSSVFVVVIFKIDYRGRRGINFFFLLKYIVLSVRLYLVTCLYTLDFSFYEMGIRTLLPHHGRRHTDNQCRSRIRVKPAATAAATVITTIACVRASYRICVSLVCGGFGCRRLYYILSGVMLCRRWPDAEEYFWTAMWRPTKTEKKPNKNGGGKGISLARRHCRLRRS